MKESGTEKYRGYLSILLVNLTQYRDLNYLHGYPSSATWHAALLPSAQQNQSSIETKNVARNPQSYTCWFSIQDSLMELP